MSKARKKIMIADDDSAIVDVLTLILEDAGYIVESTDDGRTIKDIKEDCPDLILLDIWMVGFDGRVICKYLKGNEPTKDIPLIMISANKDIKEIAMKAGADDFIAKPFDMQDLLAKVAQLIK